MLHLLQRHPFGVEAFFRRSLVLTYAIPAEVLAPLIGPGLEIDAYDAALGSPPHALVVASSEDHSSAFLLVNEEMLSNSRGVDGTANPRIHADMVFFETPSGGAVFASGSISFVASLAHNEYENSVSRLLGNAVRRFLEDTAFMLPDLS